MTPTDVRRRFKRETLAVLEREHGPDVAADAEAALRECRLDIVGLADVLGLHVHAENAELVAAAWAAVAEDVDGSA